MSTMVIKAVWPNEYADDLLVLNNAWGAGPAIWDAVCKKYLGNESAWKLDTKMGPLWRDARLPSHQRAVLAMTYSDVMILKKDYAQAASDIRKWFKDFPRTPNTANHWASIADLLESGPDCPAIGFHHNSATTDPWDDGTNEHDEESGPPAWAKKWSLYDNLADPIEVENASLGLCD